LTFRARGCGPHGSRLVRPAPRASPQPSHLWSEPTHVTTGKQPPKAASRWLLVQSRGRRWSFPFIVGEHEVVVAGSSPTANLPLRGSAPLSFYVKDVSVGLRLVRVHASSLRIDGREVPDSRLLPPSCSLEVDGEALYFSV